MLGRGAKLEATDGDKYTPLLIAARWNRMDMVKVRLSLAHGSPDPTPLVCWV
jgi:hypothetical protein